MKIGNFTTDIDPANFGPIADWVNEIYGNSASEAPLGDLKAILKTNGMDAIYQYTVGFCLKNSKNAFGYIHMLAHVASAVFHAYEGNWKNTGKEALTACITVITTPLYSIVHFLLMCESVGGILRADPSIRGWVRNGEKSVIKWSEQQIAHLEEKTSPTLVERDVWRLQMKGDLFAEGLSAYIVNSLSSFYLHLGEAH